MARTDKRYTKSKAPEIVSEKRLTFFLPQEQFAKLRLVAGAATIASATGETKLPDCPSSIVRLAIDRLLHDLGIGKPASDEVFNAIKAATTKAKK